MPPVKTATTEIDWTRPFRFHGVDLADQPQRGQAVGNCPFCDDDEAKFSVGLHNARGEKVRPGGWGCFKCGTKGDIPATFLRKLHEASDGNTKLEDYAALAKERRLLDPDTLAAWGVVRSVLSGDWLVPGYGTGGKLDQLYRYAAPAGKTGRVLMGTAGLGHALFGAHLFDPLRPDVYICEGPWDAMALWEVLRACKRGTDGGLTPTGNVEASLLASANVLAVPGCGQWREEWGRLLSGKNVYLMYDNDHSKEHPTTKTEIGLQGYNGMRRVAGQLVRVRPAVESLYFLRWGEDGYDESLKSGYDIRDVLVEGVDVKGRVGPLGGLLAKLAPVPADWVPGRDTPAVAKGKIEILPVPCGSYRELTEAWRRALRWREDLDETLSVMLAVSSSTVRAGDQLFLQVIGDAGSGKTRFCNGMLVSKHCFALEHLTGFHSGWKDNSGEDYSLLARINHKTLITPEGDVLMSSPRFIEIMSQQRRIFDGTSGASFKNRKEDMRYTGLRTPWIMAGTPALLDTDQSRLGDRFLKVIIHRPALDEQREILRQVGYTALLAVRQEANCDAASHIDERMLLAFRLTGGYVDWLRENVHDALQDVRYDNDDEVVERCMTLGEFTADMRARPPSKGHQGDGHSTKELPTRLTHQFVRLAQCMAVTLGKRSVDDEVMRKVTKVARDTSHGRTLDLVRQLYRVGNDGMETAKLAGYTMHGKEEEQRMLKFLRKVGVVLLVDTEVSRA